MSIYVEDFDSKEDVAHQFNISLEDLKDCKILYASYECGNYEGSAFVLYEEGGKFYEVNGSHCSCYGLEGQWEPEEIDAKALEHRFQYGNLDELLHGHAKDILEVLKNDSKPIISISNSRFKLD